MNSLNTLFPDHLKKIFIKISVINYINLAIGIASSILMVRLIGAQLFGKYQYCLAITEFPAVFYTGFDRIINRFISLEPKENHIKLVFSSLSIHLLATFLIVSFLFICLNITSIGLFIFSSISTPEGEKILILCLTITFFSGIFNTMTTYLSGIRKIEISQKINTASSSLGLFTLLIIYLSKPESSNVITFALGTKIMTLLISIFFVYLKFRPFFSKVFKSFLKPISNLPYIQYTLNSFFKDYAFHFQVNEIFGYFKDRIGVLILGHLGSFSSVAFYEVLKNIIAIPRKFFVQMFNTFIPQIVFSHEKNTQQFKLRFRYFCYMQFFITCLVSFAIFFLNSVLIKIYSFQNLKLYYFLTYSECLILILSAWANSNNFSLELKKDSKTLMQASIGRALIVSILSPLLTTKYETIGASVSVLISTICLVCFLSLKNKTNDIWQFKDNLKNLVIFIFCALVLYFSLDLSFDLFEKIGLKIL